MSGPSQKCFMVNPTPQTLESAELITDGGKHWLQQGRTSALGVVPTGAKPG